MKSRLCAATLIIALSVGNFVAGAAPATKKSPVKAPAAKAAPAKPAAPASLPDSAYKPIGALELVKTPEQYIGDSVRFEGQFVSFTPYALDYKPAMRASKDYIAFLIRRPDSSAHEIPLSELKLIYPRKKADKVLDVENGDKVKIKGKVFSSALGDPWVDVDDLIIVQKDPVNVAKAKKKPKKTELE